MVTKNKFWVLVGILYITAGFLGVAKEASAETLKLVVSNVVTKGEVYPVENIEGAAIISMVRDGSFISENGELGNMKFFGATGAIAGKGGSFLGYLVFIFQDGSTIMAILPSASWWPDPDKKIGGFQKASGELLLGSGKFKGIKGTLTMTGKLLKTVKGEIASKVYNDFVLIYTLSP